jgi:integrase/recombinase XerD
MPGRTPRPEEDRAVGDFLEYMQYERSASDNTIKAYRGDLESWSAFCRETGRRLYPETEAVDRFLTRLEASGLSSGTRQRRAAALSAFARFLIYDGVIESAGVMPGIPKRDKVLPVVMTEGEVERIIDGCRDGDSAFAVRDRTMIEMAYGCGLRASELVSLKLSDIDETGGVMYIRGKGRKERIVPYVGSLKETVRFYLASSRPNLEKFREGGGSRSDFLFLSKNGRQMNRRELWNILQKRGRAAGVARSRLHPHVLRHSFATHLQRRGMNLRTLQELLGHSSIAVTEKYAHLDTELRDIYDSFHPRA